MGNFMSKLLLGWADAFGTDNLNRFGDGYAKKFEWVGKVFGPISIVMYVLMGLVGAAGAVYAIYLGIMLAKADDQSKRDEARKHLITVLIAVGCTVVLVLFFNMLMPEIVTSLVLPKKTGTNTPNSNTPANIQLVVQTAKMLFMR